MVREERAMNKEKIAQIIKSSFESVYCDTCESGLDYDCCEECHRKQMYWSVSNEYAERVAEKIIGENYDQID